MTDSTPRQQRIAIIDTKRTEATRLLSAANHETLKQQVRLASRDLEEGLAWLNQENVDTRPAILKIVDITIDLASWRLTMVNNALKTYGPDAMLIG